MIIFRNVMWQAHKMVEITVGTAPTHRDKHLPCVSPSLRIINSGVKNILIFRTLIFTTLP